jgi:hypothetical protein
MTTVHLLEGKGQAKAARKKAAQQNWAAKK